MNALWLALYDEMRSKGIAINNIAYNTMLNIFAQCGAMHKVPQLLEDLKTSDPPAEPDIVTHSAIVDIRIENKIRHRSDGLSFDLNVDGPEIEIDVDGIEMKF